MSAAPAPETYILKAEAALAGARALLHLEDSDGACSRAYYAMFDAAHAALFALGIEEVSKPIKTYNGLIGKFGEYLVRGNHVAAEHGSDLNKVQNLRELADYSGDPVGMDKATWAVERAEAFLVAVKAVLAAPCRGLIQAHSQPVPRGSSGPELTKRPKSTHKEFSDVSENPSSWVSVIFSIPTRYFA